MLYCVTPKDMKEAEKKALEHGLTQESLIKAVAKGIFNHSQFLKLLVGKTNPVLLLVGKGMNGLDCLALGCELLRANIKVAAHLPFQRKPSELHDLFFTEFTDLGGTTISQEDMAKGDWRLIVDGLLGTGSKPIKNVELHDIIVVANAIVSPIVAIDIPSGIDPESGAVFDNAIIATCTFACQAPKIGCFLENAWEHVGELHSIDIGLSDYSSNISYILLEDALPLLPAIGRTVHKYQRGLVSLFSGSKEMLGAPVLAARAAFASGAGYVRSFIQNEAYEGSLLLPLETVRVLYDIHHINSLKMPDKGAIIVGPGLGKGKSIETLVQTVLEKTKLPCVLDADALHNLPTNLLNNAILTPHRGEAQTLFGISCQILTKQHLDQLSSFAAESQSYIILKGSPTFIFSPDKQIKIMGFGTPALATAGTGDVLSGILGALLAQGLSRESACTLGTILHALAGRKAAHKRTSYSVSASNVIEEIPEVLRKFLQRRGIYFQDHLPPRLASV